MFGTKKEDKLNPSQSLNTSSVNTLVQGTKVEGNVSAESDIRIDGILEGNLVCKAKVIIGGTGQVFGDIQCQNAIIEGQFKGNLQVMEMLQVKEAARVTGDVKTDKLTVHSGAVFNVTCTMGSESVKVGTSQEKQTTAKV